MARKFYFDSDLSIAVSHDHFFLPPRCQGLGIAKQIFRGFIQEYINISVTKVTVHACLDGGGYVWAKNHFTADNRSEMDIILEKAKSDLISDECNPEQFSNFIDYVFG